MQIWKLKDLKNFQEIVEFNFPEISRDQYPIYKTTASIIGIIGGGPKGLYGLDAAVNSIKNAGTDIPIEIHWFNDSKRFATGDNYRMDQPEYLLINFPIEKINMWDISKGSKTPEGMPFNNNMFQWMNKSGTGSEKIAEGDFASRALVGAYLKAGAIQILENLSPNLKVKCIEGKVEDILPDNEPGKFRLNVAGINQNSLLKYERILLATGHTYAFFDKVTNDLNLFSKQSESASYIGHVYPGDKKLKEIKSTDKVCIKGMGLTFIDTVLALSEGRGGAFDLDEQTIRYTSSGNEPIAIYAYSKSGVPMLPRIPLPKGKEARLSYISKDWVKVLVNLKGRGNIDFEADVLPVLEKEYQHLHHEKCIQLGGYSNNSLNPNFLNNGDGISPIAAKLTINELLDPFRDLTEGLNETEYHSWVVQYLEKAVEEAINIPEMSPILALSSIWQNALPYISSLYAFGGFTGASQEIFEKQYLGKFNRISFGPPLINIQKILALAETGHLFFRLGRDTEVIPNASTGKFRVYSHQTNFCKEVKFLVDARIAKPSLGEGCPELYCNLLERGLATPFKNGDYSPGCMAIKGNGNLINRQGGAIAGITLYGTPTEGVTLDNDSLSRDLNDFATGWAARWVNTLKHKNGEKKVARHG